MYRSHLRMQSDLRSTATCSGPVVTSRASFHICSRHQLATRGPAGGIFRAKDAQPGTTLGRSIRPRCLARFQPTLACFRRSRQAGHLAKRARMAWSRTPGRQLHRGDQTPRSIETYLHRRPRPAMRETCMFGRARMAGARPSASRPACFRPALLSDLGCRASNPQASQVQIGRAHV